MTHDRLCPSLGHGALPLIDLCRCGLIARVRADDEDKFLWKYSAAEQRGYNAGERAGYSAALRDAVEAVVNCDDYHSAANMLLVDAYREGLQAAREAIDALGSER